MNIDITQEIRMLTIRQPFASLMLHGKVETRKWATKYRGLVLLHAALIPYPTDDIFSMCTAQQILGMDQLEIVAAMPVKGKILLYKKSEILLPGHAFAIADLVDCRPMQRTDEKDCWVAYHSDLYCHIYENVRPIVPFELRGRQGFRPLYPEQKELIKLIDPGQNDKDEI